MANILVENVIWYLFILKFTSKKILKQYPGPANDWNYR